MDELNSSKAVSLQVVVANQPAIIRATFIKKTYLHLALSILLFVAVEVVFLNTEWIVGFGLAMFNGWWWLLMLFGFIAVTTFAESWAMEATSKRNQYIALGIFVVAEAFLFVPLIYLTIAITGDESIIRQAGLLTMFLFTGVSASVLITGKDFSMLRMIVSVGGILALGLIVVGTLFNFSLSLWFSFAMVGIATAAILYQTSNIIHKYHTEQYVAASLSLFGAFMLLFWYILDIFSSLSGD